MSSNRDQLQLPAPPPPSAPGSPVGAGQFATAALSGVIGVEVLAIITSLVTLARLADREDELNLADPVFADGWDVGLGLAYAGVFLIAGIAWMVWQSQAHANLAKLTPSVRYRPGVVFFYLIPIAGLIIPYRAVAELARAGTDRPQLRRAWWTLFLVTNALGAAGTIAATQVSLLALTIVSLVSSVTAMVAAVLAQRIIGLVNTGLWARRALAGWQPGPQPLTRRGKIGWAAASFGLALVGSAGFGVMLPTLMEVTEADPGADIELAVGDCFNEQAGDYEAISCNEPHYAEAYRTGDYPDQQFYPGSAGMQEWAEPFCYSQFESYTGVAYENSPLEFGYLYPSEQTWSLGDREVVCYLFDLSGEDLTDAVGPPPA